MRMEDFFVHVIGITSFVGYFFLVAFGGIGLSLLPIDLIKAFINRPIRKTATEAKTKK